MAVKEVLLLSPIVYNVLTLLQQRKTEEAETVEDGADEAKKAKPSEETNGAGDDADEKEAETDEQPPVSTNVWPAAVLFTASASSCYLLKDGKEQFTKKQPG